ncbi:MAG: phosphate signaling complex protein PhoU [Armatimonadota bacterium]|nr:phosphate signaling complex protein PhoU [Armatimonadota bacterium]
MSTAARRHFTQNLDDLRERVMQMGILTERMVADAVEAVAKRDVGFGTEVASRDAEIDNMELEIQSTCIVLIAREQPVAHDLRFIASAMAIATELERIGDDAVSIAKKAITIDTDIPAEYAGELADLSGKVRTMLLNALRAYATDDASLLDEVIAADAEVDSIWKSVRRRLKETMRADPDQLDAGYKLMQAFHHLEYVGDHAVSIAERLEFVRTGNMVRFNRARI